MEEFLNQLIQTGSPSAILVGVIVYGIVYLQRKQTSSKRDSDSTNIHDDILKLKFDVTNLQGRIELHDTLLSDINKQINILNTNLAILTEKIDNLTNIIKEVKNDRQLPSQ